MARPRTWLDPRTLGAGLLALAAVASLALFTTLLLRGPGGGKAQDTPDIDAPNLGALPTNQASADPRVLDGRDVRIHVTDRSDPKRIVAEMHFGELDPLPNRRYRAREATVWIFLDSGEFMLVTAPTARLTMPDGQRPESGELDGGVEMRLYDPPRDRNRPDPDRDRPTLVAQTPLFRFDLTIGEASAPRRLSVRTDRLDFVGHNMLATFNEGQRRIEYLIVREGERLTYRTQEQRPERIAPVERAPGGGEREIAGGAADRPAGGERASPADATPSPGDERPPAQGGQRRRGSPPSREQYHVRFDNNVLVVQDDRSIRADRLDVWARLIDNKLPDGALGPNRQDARAPSFSPDSSRGEREPVLQLASLDSAFALPMLARAQEAPPPHGIGESPGTRDAGGGAIPEPGSGDEVASPDGDREFDWTIPGFSPPAVSRIEDAPARARAATPGGEEASTRQARPARAKDGVVTLTWTGPMEMTPLGETPAELRDQNHVALRFSALESGRVLFADAGSASEGFAGTIEYRATRKELVLSGLGPHAVRLLREGSGLLEAGRVELDLVAGLARVPGPGIAHALGRTEREADAARPRRVSWTERADFGLSLRQNEISGTLEWAKLAGRVEAIDGAARLSGEVMDATFYREGHADPRVRAGSLRHLEVTGPVVGADGRGAALLGERLSVDFQAADERGRSDPRTVSIEGSARASRDGATLDARIIDARLERSEEDRLVVAFVSAREDVRFTDARNNIEATSDRLRADATLRIADLDGESVVLRQGNDEIHGTQVHLSGGDRLIEVFGAGSFTRRSEGDSPIAHATWTKQMVFDDRKGTLDCYGEAFARWRPRPRAIDDVWGERVHVELTPYRESSAGETALGVSVSEKDRRVLRVRAIGGILLEDGGKPAIAQSLRESPVDPPEGEDRAIETLLRLEGPEIAADNTTGELRVDHPGTLVVADHRDGGGEPSDGASGASGNAPPDIRDPSSMRGSALFEWSRSMVVRQFDDTIDMDGNVRMTHVRLGDQMATRLLCEHLQAGFEREGDAGDDPALGNARLRSVRANGNVYVKSGRQELMGDEVLYDARRATIEAQAREGGRVTYVDARTGTPTSARRIWWDLNADRIEVRQPGALVLPR